MYRLLSSGALGNTIPIFTTVTTWQSSLDFSKYPFWGVRSFTAGDSRMRLNVPREEVAEYISTNFPTGSGFNISPMIDQWCQFKGEVFEQSYAPCQLCLYATYGTAPWRQALRDHGQTWFGLQAKNLLKGHMDAASYNDVMELLDLYPGHVIEFSVCDRQVGMVPGRNTVIWEVRDY